jgi:hypothetical protein
MAHDPIPDKPEKDDPLERLGGYRELTGSLRRSPDMDRGFPPPTKHEGDNREGKWVVVDFGMVRSMPKGPRRFQIFLPPSKRRVAG